MESLSEQCPNHARRIRAVSNPSESATVLTTIRQAGLNTGYEIPIGERMTADSLSGRPPSSGCGYFSLKVAESFEPSLVVMVTL